MPDIEPPNAPKKRKIEFVEDEQIEDQAATSKLKKMEESNEEASSSSEDSCSSDSCSDESTDSSDNSDTDDEDIDNMLFSFVPPLPQPQQSDAAQHTINQSSSVLDLRKGTEFEQMMSAFSKETAPDKITYKGRGYNLTPAFHNFWKTLYSLPNYCKGRKIKLPNTEELSEEQLTAIAKIIRRGWEDEHYFPKKLAEPFMETCLFNRENKNDIKVTKDMLLNFVDPHDKKIIKKHNRSTVDSQTQESMMKYCSRVRIVVGDKIDEACIKLMREIIFTNTELIEMWTRELAGLLELEEFKFLMRPKNKTKIIANKEDIKRPLKAPHKVYHTFLYGFSREMVKYYSLSLEDRYKIGSSCYRCGLVEKRAKHFLNLCKGAMSTMFKERHDCVLRIIHNELDLALKKRSGLFASGEWKSIVMYGNKLYDWPAELSALRDASKFPHMMVYSIVPEKRALIIEPSVSWEHWLRNGVAKDEKTRKYMGVKTILEKSGFRVDLEVIVLGSRGVLNPQLHNLFDKFFGMKQSNISRAMEKISKKIVSVAYNDHKEQMARIGRKV